MIPIPGASNRHVKYRYFFRLCGAIRAAKLESLTIFQENTYIFSDDEEVVDFIFSFALSDIWPAPRPTSHTCGFSAVFFYVWLFLIFLSYLVIFSHEETYVWIF